MQSELNEQPPRFRSLGRLGPTIALKEGIDINELTRPGGAGTYYCTTLMLPVSFILL